MAVDALMLSAHATTQLEKVTFSHAGMTPLRIGPRNACRSTIGVQYQEHLSHILQGRLGRAECCCCKSMVDRAIAARCERQSYPALGERGGMAEDGPLCHRAG